MAHMGTRCASKPEPFVIVQLYPAKQIWLPEEVLDQCAKGGWYKRMKAIARARERESESVCKRKEEKCTSSKDSPVREREGEKGERERER